MTFEWTDYLVHDCTGGGWTALHEAAKAGDPKMVAALLAGGAEVNAVAEGLDQTPLFVAAAVHPVGAPDEVARELERRSTVVDLLLDAGADPAVDSISEAGTRLARFAELHGFTRLSAKLRS